VSDEELNARFDQLARKIDANQDSLQNLARVFADALLDTRQTLETRIDGLEGKLDVFRDETHANFDHVHGRLDRLETEYDAISAGLRRVEKRFSEDL